MSASVAAMPRATRLSIFAPSVSTPSTSSVLRHDGAFLPENTGPDADSAMHDAAVPNRSASLPPIVRVTSRVDSESASTCGGAPRHCVRSRTSSLVAPAHVTSVSANPKRAAIRCG